MSFLIDKLIPKIVTVDQVLPLRQKVLRPHLSISDSQNQEDRLPSSLHIGIEMNNQIISVGSFYQGRHKDLIAANPYRLRGMATEEKYRGQGWGSELILFAIEELKLRNADLLWMHARIKAFPFYESLGFKFHGDYFEQPISGVHKVMYKRLS